MNEKEKINSDVKYESRDVSGVLLGAIGLLIVITAILLHFLVWGLYGSLKEKGISAVPEAESRQQYDALPEPNLKPNPIENYREFRRAEDEKLNDYGWIDKEKGIVHIPIEQAIGELAQKGLPAIQPPNQTPPINVNAKNSMQNNLPTATAAAAAAGTGANAMNQQQPQQQGAKEQ